MLGPIQVVILWFHLPIIVLSWYEYYNFEPFIYNIGFNSLNVLLQLIYNFLNVLFLGSMPFPYSNLKCVLARNPLYNWVMGLWLGSPSNCMAIVL
jgi:hypothetical protein